jgi:hypothetical protein
LIPHRYLHPQIELRIHLQRSLAAELLSYKDHVLLRLFYPECDKYNTSFCHEPTDKGALIAGSGLYFNTAIFSSLGISSLPL